MLVSALCAWLHMDDFVTHEHRLMCENAFACKIIRLYLKAIIIYLHLVSFRCIGCYRKLEYINVIKKKRAMRLYVRPIDAYVYESVCLCLGEWKSNKLLAAWRNCIHSFFSLHCSTSQKTNEKETPVGELLGQKFCFHFTSFCFCFFTELNVTWVDRFVSLGQRYNSTTKIAHSMDFRQLSFYLILLLLLVVVALILVVKKILHDFFFSSTWIWLYVWSTNHFTEFLRCTFGWSGLGGEKSMDIIFMQRANNK